MAYIKALGMDVLRGVADLQVVKGATFPKVFRWGGPVLTYKNISGITQAAPAVVTAVGHGLPNGWPVNINSVSGMTQINDNNYYIATVLTADTLALGEINAAAFSAYAAGGILQYPTPVDLTGYTPHANFRSSASSATAIMDLTVANGRMAIDNTAKTITMTIAAADTALLQVSRAVYSIDMTSAGGIVTTIITGNVIVTKDPTN